jgi:hypothetical protein
MHSDAHFDGDGKADGAVHRAGAWFIWRAGHRLRSETRRHPVLPHSPGHYSAVRAALESIRRGLTICALREERWGPASPRGSHAVWQGEGSLNARVLLIATLFSLSACTSVTVRPPDPTLMIRHVCIQENPKVRVSDFVPVLRDGFDRHGISTEVYSGTRPPNCDFVLTYTALRSWDLAPYLSHAELRLERDGRRIAYAEYHLVGKGGFSLMKWQGTKAKMDPVIDELLKR